MGISLKDPNLKEAARYCGFCRNYCESNMIANKNVHSRQALVFLKAIKNSGIARKAEKVCKDCNHKSAGIISLLAPYGIRIHMEEPLDSSFRAAAQNCQFCYDSRKKSDIENISAGFAQQCIRDIMNSYDEESRNYKLADELSTYCSNKCDFRDPKIKNDLEGHGISL